MKLHELLNNQQVKQAGKTQVGTEPTDDTEVDPTLEPKKRQLKMLKRQLDSLMTQKVSQSKLGRENIPLDKRIESIKKKINDIKATMLDSLEVSEK
jgi:predicted RNase H-like nuclease (RuvC/YqgF family)